MKRTACVILYKERLITNNFNYFKLLFDSISKSLPLKYVCFVEVDEDGTQLDTAQCNSISLDVTSSHPPSNK